MMQQQNNQMCHYLNICTKKQSNAASNDNKLQQGLSSIDVNNWHCFHIHKPYKDQQSRPHWQIIHGLKFKDKTLLNIS